jgi:type IV secretory pathway VirB10-like protein
MLAVVVAAGLTPNAGLVQAQSNSQYNQSPSSSGLSPWVWGAIAIVAVAVILLAALIALRRRRPPAAAPPPPMAAWQAGPSAPTAPAAPPAPPAAPPPPAAAPAYLETPEDVGVPPPSVPVSKVAAAGAGAAAAGAAGAVEAEPDIDSLMAELDKISGEILKRAPKKGSGTQAEPTDEEPKP